MGKFVVRVYHPGRDFRLGGRAYGQVDRQGLHLGLDFIADASTRVPAAADGRVVGRGFDSAYGNIIILRHPTATPYVYTLYAHLQTFDVSLEQEVQGGDALGTVGVTGTGSNNEAHLHFELIKLEETSWEDRWLAYSRFSNGLWRGSESTPVPLSLPGDEGRYNPLKWENWVGIGAYNPAED